VSVQVLGILDGGISEESIEVYLDAGDWVFGIGSELVNPEVTTEFGMENLLDRARRFVAAARKRT
jgi:2-keto-3-deoxy-6-phosphogluconate aldolase